MSQDTVGLVRDVCGGCFNEKVTLHAPPECVSRLFVDVDRVSTCIPGVEQLEHVGPDAYSAALGTSTDVTSSATIAPTARRGPVRIVLRGLCDSLWSTVRGGGGLRAARAEGGERR